MGTKIPVEIQYGSGGFEFQTNLTKNIYYIQAINKNTTQNTLTNILRGELYIRYEMFSNQNLTPNK